MKKQKLSDELTSNSIINRLPKDLWCFIFSFFNKQELREIAQVGKAFYQLIQEKNLIEKAPLAALEL